MQNAESLSHEQVLEFLRSSRKIEFAGCRRAEIYAWVERTLAVNRKPIWFDSKTNGSPLVTYHHCEPENITPNFAEL